MSTSRVLTARCSPTFQRRSFQNPAVTTSLHPDFGFSFDIDGVLLRSSSPLPGAISALKHLQANRIPFILLTNGGGRSETARVNELSTLLDVPLNVDMFVQSHTPFAELRKQYEGKTVLVIGGHEGGNLVRKVAEDDYGFSSVVTPADILCAYPSIWPFASQFLPHYKEHARPLPLPINPTAGAGGSLKIDGVFVYNDPRDWGLDSTVLLDLLLSSQGLLGTLSPKNGDNTLPNNGYQQDSQPAVYFSNPDLFWASSHALPRLGQGGFQAAFRGLWNTVTNGAVLLNTTTIGKPSQHAYEFAETRLRAHRKALFGHVGLNDPLRKVYMIGDNPESDIRGANEYVSQHGTQWRSVLVETGVHQRGSEPKYTPNVIVQDVGEAVRWAIEDAKKG